MVVGGPPGSGKTTLAHKLAASLGCPLISRDEIKQGMAHGTPGFVAAPGDELTQRTFPVFFAVLELLLRSGVTTVAEAAFQDHVWRPRLEPLGDLARIRVVHCAVDAGVAVERTQKRGRDDPLRRVHADPARGDAAEREQAHRAFRRLGVGLAWASGHGAGVSALEVDTTDGYRPSFGHILSFINEGIA